MTDLNTAQMTGGLVDELVGQYCIELERLNYGRETINLYLRSIRRSVVWPAMAAGARTRAGACRGRRRNAWYPVANG